MLKALVAVALLTAACVACAQLKVPAPRETHALVVVVEGADAFYSDLVAVHPTAEACEAGRRAVLARIENKEWRGVQGVALVCARLDPLGPKT